MILLKTDPWVSSQIERVREMEGKEGGVEKERQRERESKLQSERGAGEKEKGEKRWKIDLFTCHSAVYVCPVPQPALPQQGYLTLNGDFPIIPPRRC